MFLDFRLKRLCITALIHIYKYYLVCGTLYMKPKIQHVLKNRLIGSRFLSRKDSIAGDVRYTPEREGVPHSSGGVRRTQVQAGGL